MSQISIYGNNRTVEAVSSQTQHLILASVSENTKLVYQRTLSKLENWLGDHPLTDEVLAEYLTEEYGAGKAPSTISMIPAAVRFASRLAGNEAPIGPLTERTLGGIRREGRARGRGQVTGISFLEVQFLASKLEQDSVKGLRDANILSVMSDCMLRVGELVDLLIRDIVWMDDQSARLHLRHSKTDQLGEGAALYLGPPTAARLRKWIQAIESSLGPPDPSSPLFRPIRRGGHIQTKSLTAHATRRIIKNNAEAAGLSGRFSGHSLRVGTAQSLARLGATLPQLQTVGRWKSARMPAQYCRNEIAGRSVIATLLYDE